MKYVVLQETESGFRTIVLCVAPLTHRDLANRFVKTHAPVSAGFCEFLADGHVRVFGESESLRLKPAAGDGPLIEHLARATRKIAASSAALPASVQPE